ncbi:lutropin-choriogonadotropic hormone receptor-like isoform X2 [Dysidea avara]|uniref:lutropin-choriogonadotropic hormone receptor-like isoform X2 n=1 Tax=Dysidea avara TaxID=196820 RepID=UPI003321F9B9
MWNPVRLQFNMATALFLALLAMRLAIVRGVICNNDPSLDRDVFEEHGCACGTIDSLNEGLNLKDLYHQAFEDCHEDDRLGDRYTIDCSFSTLGNDEDSIAKLLNRTMLDRLPDGPGNVSLYENITCLLLNGNNITHITYDHMKQFPKLKRLYLDTTQLQKIDDDALIDNTELITLNIANNGLKEIPFLGHLRNLEKFYAGKNDIENVRVDAFVNNTRLQLLSMPHNKLKDMPNISYHMELNKIHLEHNHIQRLPVSKFYGLAKMHELVLHHNHISRLEDGMCRDMCRLATLDISHNRIQTIEEDAFRGCHIEYLDLSNNIFDWLPHKDLRLSVEYINVKDVSELIQFPPAYTNGTQTFPTLDNLIVTYAIHCCWYEDYVVHTPNNAVFADFNETQLPENCTKDNILSCFPDLNRTQVNQSQVDCPSRPTNFTEKDIPFNCTPHGDPFHPCYDIIEYLWLRIIIWFVIVISLCGNVLVFTVLLYGAVKKSLTVPQLMIMNLAASDFCLGLYLLFIAAADLDTAGNYFNKAFDWERSAACKTAGFFAVLSSTASICILGLITFERMTTIVFTFRSRNIMTLIKTAVCLVIVWVVAFLFAIFPIFKINSYNRIAICLPVDLRDKSDKLHIGFLLFFTGAVCVFILICYVILFVRVQKTTSSLTTRQEFKLALKIAVLVVTDFLIWVPIAVFGLAGLFTGDPIIRLQATKYILIFLFPINSFLNPLLYSLMQSSFRNQMCDAIANLGLCQDYHKHRRNHQRGLSFATTSKQSGSRFRLSSLSAISSNSLMNLFGKKSTTCQLQQFTNHSRSCRSTSSDPNGLIEEN